MTRNRLAYLGILIGSILFYILHSGHIAWVMLLMVLGVLPLNILLSLPIWLSTRLQIQTGGAEVVLGQPFVLRLRVSGRWPVCTIRTRLRCENLFTRQTSRARLRLRPGCEQDETLHFQTTEFGAVRCTFSRPFVLDVAGLFAFPLKKIPPVLILVRPAAGNLPWALPALVTQPGTAGEAAPAPHARRGLREYVDIREYRQGDSLRDVHWKLSSKLDKLMVREAGYPHATSLRLLFSPSGAQEQSGAVLARLEAYSGMLSDLERPHELCWPGGDEAPQNFAVASRLDYDNFLWQLLSQPAPQKGETSVQATSAGLVLHIRPQAVALYKEGRLLEVLE